MQKIRFQLVDTYSPSVSASAIWLYKKCRNCWSDTPVAIKECVGGGGGAKPAVQLPAAVASSVPPPTQPGVSSDVQGDQGGREIFI